VAIQTYLIDLIENISQNFHEYFFKERNVSSNSEFF